MLDYLQSYELLAPVLYQYLINLKYKTFKHMKNLIKCIKALRLYSIRCSNFVIKDEELSEFMVRIQHKVPRHGSIVVKYKDKYYRIRELG